MANVRLSEIQKNFRGIPILTGLSLDIQSGEYVVLLGKSGCGKTTTLRIIAGLDAPDFGEVHIADRIVNRIRPRKRDVSMVFQADALYPHLTVRQSMSLGAAPRAGKAEQEKAFDAALSITGVEPILDRLPSKLSGGEIRRASIAKAIMRGAAVRLLDEPLSGLDANVRHDIQDALLKWHRQTPGATIQVTHDGQEAMRVADKIAVMDGGKITQLGTPSEIYDRPRTQSVALAIGTPPMNFLSATMTDGEVSFGDDSVSVTCLASVETSEPKFQVGCRPSDALIGGVPSDGAALSIEGHVAEVDRIHNGYLATVQTGIHRVRVMADDPMDQNARIQVWWPKRCVHAFDAAGARLEV